VLTIPNYARWPSISSPRALLRAAEFSFLLFRFLLLLLLLRFFTSAPVRALADLMEFRKPVWQNVPRACASATSSLRRDNAAPNMGGTLLRDCSLRLRLGTMKRNGTRRAVCSPFSQKKCLLCLTLGDPRERHPNCSLPLRDQERLRISQARAFTIKILAASSRDIPAASLRRFICKVRSRNTLRDRERERERKRPKLAATTRDTAPRDTAMHYLLRGEDYFSLRRCGHCTSDGSNY